MPLPGTSVQVRPGTGVVSGSLPTSRTPEDAGYGSPVARTSAPVPGPRAPVRSPRSHARDLGTAVRYRARTGCIASLS